MRPYVCYNCLNAKGTPGRQFIAAQPICPTCGADRVNDPKAKHVILDGKLIHFEGPHAIIREKGCGKLACGLQMANRQFSGDPDAVNCPKCKASPEWIERHKAKHTSVDELQEFDVPNVEIDPNAEQYKTPKPEAE